MEFKILPYQNVIRTNLFAQFNPDLRFKYSVEDKSLPSYIEKINQDCINSTNSNEVDKYDRKLSVWIRAGGEPVKSKIVSFIEKISKILSNFIDFEIIVCTNKNDIILEELDTITKTEKSVKVIFSQLNSFSTALTTLAKNTDAESSVLTLSVGVNIRQDQIEEGLNYLLKDRVRVHGWTVTENANDGSVPGKGWYNTAALIDKNIVKQIREEGVPKWVDNGILGKIDKHTIGGNEEIPIMIQALLKESDAKFILNRSDPVSIELEVGTEISFKEKLERKTIVGEVYMEKIYKEWTSQEVDFETWKKNMWQSLIIH
jgi:hypothetical protein